MLRTADTLPRRYTVVGILKQQNKWTLAVSYSLGLYSCLALIILVLRLRFELGRRGDLVAISIVQRLTDSEDMYDLQPSRGSAIPRKICSFPLGSVDNDKLTTTKSSQPEQQQVIYENNH